MTPLITLARRFRQWAVLFALVTAAPFSSAQVFAPDGGLWWNPAASGHGYHLAPAGGNLAVVWYSYDSDGRPTWYLAAASLTGSTWTADLQSYHWDGAARAATGTSVSRISSVALAAAVAGTLPT